MGNCLVCTNASTLRKESMAILELISGVDCQEQAKLLCVLNGLEVDEGRLGFSVGEYGCRFWGALLQVGAVRFYSGPYDNTQYIHRGYQELPGFLEVIRHEN